ncbi:MAG: shikimate kinase AroK [Proteobacteria bacterium]|nr:shikimate kinase AroK [Pseudomonadota bacterium]MCH8099122.1 shikimate kinase AroK [Pseudomonadota bacterium]MCH8277306.1 shikimate kinase AroK [Pseudomonadota bacterium]
MKHPRNIFLIGPMGAGKSAVGRYLARTLHLSFVDSDDEIESRTGVDIAFIFEKEGEQGFRKREAAVIDDLSKIDGVVLATGGGAVVDPENRSRLGGRGYVVYLYTSVDEQVSRTQRGRKRPMLENDNPRGTLEELLAKRDPLYREIADLVVETDGRKVKSVANEIIEQIS